MNKLGDIDVDRLEEIKAQLFEKADDPLINDALIMIKDLESMVVTTILNHRDYVEWACKQMFPGRENPLTQSED